MIRDCKKHGLVLFYTSKEKPYGFCSKCNIERVNKFKNRRKQYCIDYKGGKCFDCGESFPNAIYDFHHLDPNTKSFNVSNKAHCVSLEILKQELDKCDMLCVNCHRIRHNDQ